LQLQVGQELTVSYYEGEMKKRKTKARTPPRGTFLGRRLLALDALLERLIFLALPPVLLQARDLFERRNQKTKEKTRHAHANVPVIRRVRHLYIVCERVNIYICTSER